MYGPPVRPLLWFSQICPREGSLQKALEPDLCGRPIVNRKGVIYSVANETVTHHCVAAQDSVADSTESFHGTLRSKISCVSIQFNPVRQKCFEGVIEELRVTVWRSDDMISAIPNSPALDRG